MNIFINPISKGFKIGLLVAGIAVPLILFQNCSQGEFRSDSASSSDNENLSVPDGDGLGPIRNTPNTPGPLARYKKLVTGMFSSRCGLDSNNILYCEKNQGISGPLTYGYKEVPALGPIKKAALGSGFGCAITMDEKVKCWGLYNEGQTGMGFKGGDGAWPPNYAQAQEIASLTNVKDISAGVASACVLTNANKIFCWGQSMIVSGGTVSPTEVVYPRLTETISKIYVSQIAPFGLLLAQSGNLYMSENSRDTENNPVPIESGVMDVSMGSNHWCAVKTNGTIKCGGPGAPNNFGQLGNGQTFEYLNTGYSVEVVGISNAVSVSVGSSHSCATLADATVKCWGANSSGTGSNEIFGLLGNGSEVSFSSTPVVASISGVKEVSLTMGNACALLNDNSVTCWGFADTAMGFNDQFFSSKPVDSSQFSTIKELSINCWLTNTNQIDCFKKNGIPNSVFQLNDVKQLAQGYNNSCLVLRSNGQVKCWGYDYTSGLTDVPEAVQASKLVMGYGHACVLESSGTVKCWLAGAFFDVAESKIPKAIEGLGKVVDIAAAQGSSCALIQGGSVKCWGEMFSDGANSSAAKVVDIAGLSNAKSIVGNANSQTYCAVTTDNKVKCWGSNYVGLLGRGTNVTQDLAADEVIGVSSIRKVIVGGQFNCALGLNGSVKCWGSNENYAINSNPSISNYAIPTLTSLSDKQVVDMFSSWSGSIFIFADGTRGFSGLLNSSRSYKTPGIVFMRTQ